MLSPTVILVPLPTAGFTSVLIICTTRPEPKLSPGVNLGVVAPAEAAVVLTYLI